MVFLLLLDAKPTFAVYWHAIFYELKDSQLFWSDLISERFSDSVMPDGSGDWYPTTLKIVNTRASHLLMCLNEITCGPPNTSIQS